MEDPRDSWYKPNLLYNIHYRPPTPPTPPKRMVVTREFNASVCTCGEHGCGPHYRMEREVVWSNKEARKEESGESKGKIQDGRDVSNKTEGIDGDSIKDDGDGNDDEEEEEEEEAADGGGGDDDGDDDDDDGENDTKSKSDADNASTSNGEKLIEMKIDTTKLVQSSNAFIKGKGLNSVPRFDDLAEPETPDIDLPDIEEPTINLDGDNEECGSCFGIMRVYCDSEIHTSWNGNSKFYDH